MLILVCSFFKGNIALNITNGIYLEEDFFPTGVHFIYMWAWFSHKLKTNCRVPYIILYAPLYINKKKFIVSNE